MKTNITQQPLPRIIHMTEAGYQQYKLQLFDKAPTLTEQVMHAVERGVCTGCYRKKAAQAGLCPDCINDLFANAPREEIPCT